MPVPTNPHQSPVTYHSYLIRLWQDHVQGPWRASAHCVQTGETVRFGSIEALLAYLMDQSATAREADAPSSSG